MFEFLKSTRSIAVVMVLILLFVVVIGSFFKELPDSILALVGSVVTGVVIAYFGKRDSEEDRFTRDPKEDE